MPLRSISVTSLEILIALQRMNLFHLPLKLCLDSVGNDGQSVDEDYLCNDNI